MSSTRIASPAKKSDQRQNLAKESHLSCDLVLRVVPQFQTSGGMVDIVRAHNEVFAAKGRVALAKFGSALSSKVLKALQCQIERGQVPHLYLAYKEETIFRLVGSRIGQLVIGALTADLRDIVPAFYADLEKPPASWFILSGGLVPVQASNLYLASSGRNLSSVMAECRTPAMLVHRR